MTHPCVLGSGDFLLAGANLIVLISAAVLGAVSFSSIQTQGLATLISAILLALSLALSIVLQLLSLDRTWFVGRAVAESIRTLAWRYVTRSVPFDVQTKDADNLFCRRVSQILLERRHFLSELGGKSSSNYITECMRSVRNSNRKIRGITYLNQRIKQQRKWYSDGTRINKRKEIAWFVALIIAQFCALVSAILRVRYLCPINFTPVLVSIAAALLAWRQLKRFQELAQAYGSAAQELTAILSKGRSIKTEDDLSAFVSDAENAISREHTMWLARRDNM